MNVAVLSRPTDPLSLRLYQSNIIRELSAIGVEISLFPDEGPTPAECDLVWDPGMCMRRIPNILRTCTLPVIGTMHGVKAFSLPIEELAVSSVEREALQRLKEQIAKDWSWFGEKVAAMVAVSDFCKTEMICAFSIDPEKVHVIHHGVDRCIFVSEGRLARSNHHYLLHVSRLDPIKNIDRILAAYSALPMANRPDLFIVGLPEPDQTDFYVEFGRKVFIPGVKWLPGELSQEELAPWYRGALALILPSLRETFGLPIIEAMACGCPVVTSNDTGCAETAGDAAILVDPRSITEITKAMQRVVEEPNIRRELRKAGLERARNFTWQKSADLLRRVFQSVLPLERKHTPKMRKIEVTTVAACRVGCSFCPQPIFQRNYTSTGARGIMDWETYTKCINKLPLQVGVSFGGMSEPFQNPICTDMVLYAKSRGHRIEIFTTLLGLSIENLDKLLKALALGSDPVDDRWFVHLPSAERYENLIIDEKYLLLVNHLLSSTHYIEFHYHGSKIHDALCALPWNGRLRHWPFHNRADSETPFYGRSERRAGEIECVMNLEVNFLLPNGDVLICCQDFGFRHVIGNLLKDDVGDLYSGAVFRHIQQGLADDTEDTICRYCHFAVEANSPEGAIRT